MAVNPSAKLREKILQRLDHIEDLPSLPLVVIKLTEAIQDVESSAADVARIMEDDPAIMARVLKIVNSAFYSRSPTREPITNVKHAIVRLGYDAIRNIALTSSVFSVFKDDHALVFDRKEFWRHCICTGIVSRVVLDFSNLKNSDLPRETITLAGLLHDMGKIILEQYFYDLFTRILEFAQRNKQPIHEIEMLVYESSHSEIGAWLARRWKLGPEILACIEFHHKPTLASESTRNMVGLVHIADYITNLKGLGQSGNTVPPVYKQEVWESFDLDLTKIPEILAVVDEEAKKSELLLSLI